MSNWKSFTIALVVSWLLAACIADQRGARMTPASLYEPPPEPNTTSEPSTLPPANSTSAPADQASRRGPRRVGESERNSQRREGAPARPQRPDTNAFL